MKPKSIVASLAVCLLGLGGVTVHPSASQAPQPNRIRFQVAATGNEARYKVREQFLSVNFPSDAVGSTKAITGTVVLDTSGKVVASESRLVIDITTLKSDQENRDRMVQGRTLETAQFPTVEVGVTDLRGLKYPWPAAGEFKFELVGELKIHGVTKPWTWQVTASSKDGGLTGRATTALKFGDFGMTVPTSFRLLSVEDNIRLEYDFHFVPVK